jgi:SulP family sulfate permease
MAHEVVRNIRHWVRGEFRSKSLLPGLIYGLLLGVNEVFFSLSLGSLIFSGDLSPYLSYGVGIALASSAVMLIGVSLTSMIPGVIGSTQDTNVIMGVMAAALASGLTAARAEQRLATILAAIAITTLLTGVFCLLLSYFKLGKLVRFVPYPVVGGFLAGTGWLLLLGSFSVMTDLLLTTQNIPRLLQPDKIVLWVPAVVFALVLFIGLRRIQHFLVMPAIVPCWRQAPPSRQQLLITSSWVSWPGALPGNRSCRANL